MDKFWKIMNVIGFGLMAGVFGILSVRAGKSAIDILDED